MSAEVHQMFSAIAPKYDAANDVLSFGVHRLWRRAAVKLSSAQAGDKVIDCATGTGDLALAFKRAVGPEGEVLGTDFNADMLSTAPAKAKAQGLDVAFEVADALALPYQAARFDVASISFGIRNVDDPVRCLKELARVTKPGGRVVVVEFGQPDGLFGVTFRAYARHVMPRLGQALTGRRDAYEYLPRTAQAFPAGDRFLGLMREARSFSSMQGHPQLGGLSWIYVGVVGPSA